MLFVSGVPANCPGLVHPRQAKKLLFQCQRCNGIRFYYQNGIQPVRERVPRGGIQYFLEKSSSSKRVHSVGRHYHQLNFDDDIAKDDPLWLSLIKEAIWALKSLLMFLVEQPSQLKHIEWPGFQNTLKTATLTLVLVALLIVALSSVDALLSYLLAWHLRKTP